MKINFDDGRFAIIDILKNDKGTYEYYNHGVLIGVYDPDVMQNSKFLEVNIEKVNSLENELSDESKDKINALVEKIKEEMELIPREDIENDAKANKTLDKYLAKLGIDKENVKIIDIERKKDEAELENEDKEIDEKDKEREDEKEKNEEEEKDNIITRDDVSVKQEIDLNERANGMQDLEQWLGNKIPKNFTKLAAIPTSQIFQFKDEEGNNIENSTTRYSLVLISNDNRVEPLKTYIPELEQNHSVGNNPTQEEYQVSSSGKVEKDAIASEYRIGNKIIQIDDDFTDNKEINISELGPFTNEKMSRELRGKQEMEKPNREIVDGIGGYYSGGIHAAENSKKEVEKHDEAGDNLDELDPEDYDGNEKTFNHVHITEENIDQYVEKIKEEAEEVGDIFTDKEIAERLMKKVNEKEEITDVDSLVEETKEELQEDASRFPSHERN